jgi:hypothetical protein
VTEPAPSEPFRLADLIGKPLREVRDYARFLLAFPRRPRAFIAALGPPSHPVFNRGLAFFALGVFLSLIISHLSVRLLPHEEQIYFEDKFDIGRIHLVLTAGLFILAAIFWACLRVIGGAATTYVATLNVLAYLYAFIWPALALFNFVASRVFSAMLGTWVIIVPPWDMRSIGQIESTFARKVVLAMMLTVLTAEAFYLVYLYFVAFRTLDRMAWWRTAGALAGGLLIAWFTSTWAVRAIDVVCSAVHPLCDFL